MRKYVDEKRQVKNSCVYDIVTEGETPGDNKEKADSLVRPLAEAGVTWWLEAVWATLETKEGMRKRIKQGPRSY